MIYYNELITHTENPLPRGLNLSIASGARGAVEGWLLKMRIYYINLLFKLMSVLSAPFAAATAAVSWVVSGSRRRSGAAAACR